MERTEQDMIENKRAENTGLYDPSFEHDNCGIGAVVNIKGIKTHDTVNNALKIVENLEHRAGKDAEGKTGDGVKRYLKCSVPNVNAWQIPVAPLTFPLQESLSSDRLFFLPYLQQNR